jgi:DNA ligase-1
MTFKRLSSYLEKLEDTSSRNEMTAVLAELFKEAKASEIDKICYLSLGGLAPKYEGIEFNIAEKMMTKILATTYKVGGEEVRKRFKKVGDLGEVASELAKTKDRRPKTKIEVTGVFEKLYEIATTSGEGSVEQKITLFAKLLLQLDPLSAKYVVRVPIGRLRLGFSDITILDALSWMKASDKSLRPELEQAYNTSADIGKIAKVFKERGIKGVKKIGVSVGTPIRTAQAERLPTAEKIIEKLERLGVEPKYDGFRVQIHLDKTKRMEKSSEMQIGLFNLQGPFVHIFSRNLENITHMFPDIVNAVQKFPVDRAIFDGEAIAYNEETGEFLPFQETVQRKRKHDIAAKARKIPLKVFIYDLLYLNGRPLINEVFEKRRALLVKTLGDPEKTARHKLVVAKQDVIKKAEELKELFDLYISQGLEGVMCKKLDSVYQAGARNFNWVKYKRTTEGELADTIDCVVMGYYRGRGKRAGFGIGAFLTGVYDEASDQFVTIAKIGTGLTDEQWGEMKKRCDGVKAPDKPARFVVDKNLDPDVWCEPAMVVEIKADEITRSPVHTAAKDSEALGVGGPGLALRFPRLVDFRDKDPEQATTVEEVLRLYGMQGK